MMLCERLQPVQMGGLPSYDTTVSNVSTQHWARA